jgi:uncharacterized caspase-like protein
VDGARSALIIASDVYADAGLKRLRAPANDARELAAVLHDPAIGGFEVRTLLNEPAHEVNLAVEEFFADRLPDDLLLLHFSCHGVKDEGGELYFAMANTLLRRLGATAVAAEFVNRRMSRSRSRRVVLLLDCCYAGAFERGMTARAGEGMGIESQFGGRGRAVITASSAMEYAFEGDKLADARELAPSVFTSALVEGLETGDADRDQDGLVALDELYDYVYEKVRTATPNQTPGKWTFGVQGELVIARRSRPVTRPAPLPPELEEASDSRLAAVRAAAVQELEHLLHGRHAGLALAARQALETLTNDDSRTVAAAAAAALSTQAQPEQGAPVPGPPGPVPPELAVSATAIDFGRLPRHGAAPEHRIRLSNAGGGTLNARSATQASWLNLRQAGDELVITVDTSAEGEHEGRVTVDSDGGSATIRVRAHVESALAPETSAETSPVEAAPAGPVPAPPGRPNEPGTQGKAAVTQAAPIAAAAPPPIAETKPSPTLDTADRSDASSTLINRMLLGAGGFAIAGGVLVVLALFPPYVQSVALSSNSPNSLNALIAAAIAICASILIMVARTRRLIAPGLLLGGVATAPIGPVYDLILGPHYGSPGPGLWLDLAGNTFLTIAGCMAWLALARTGDVHVRRRRLKGVLPWLVALAGAVGAVMLVFQVLNGQDIPGRAQGFVPSQDAFGLIWGSGMALVVPAVAAVALPRRFGVALLAGWIGSSLMIVSFYGVGNGLFGLTIVALLGLIIPFARASSPSQVSVAAVDDPSKIG